MFWRRWRRREPLPDCTDTGTPLAHASSTVSCRNYLRTKHLKMMRSLAARSHAALDAGQEVSAVRGALAASAADRAGSAVGAVVDAAYEHLL